MCSQNDSVGGLTLRTEGRFDREDRELVEQVEEAVPRRRVSRNLSRVTRRRNDPLELLVGLSRRSSASRVLLAQVGLTTECVPNARGRSGHFRRPLRR